MADPFTFPELEGDSLSRRRHAIPADLAGDVNLVFVAFLRRQQGDVDAWLDELGPVESEHAGLMVYELPLLKRYPAFYRQWIDNGMRAGIPDPDTRDRTITVYTDRRTFLDAVGLPNEDQIWVALLGPAGRVLWSHIGGPTDDALHALRSTLHDYIAG